MILYKSKFFNIMYELYKTKQKNSNGFSLLNSVIENINSFCLLFYNFIFCFVFVYCKKNEVKNNLNKLLYYIYVNQ